MIEIPENCFEEFIAAAHKVAQYGLVLCGSGNLSYRVSKEHMLITVSGAWMPELSREEITVCNITDGTSTDRKSISIESGFHRAILRERQNIHVVLHFQSPFATTIACSKKPERDFCVIPEIPYYVGTIGVVPYMQPGSDDLAQAVTSVIRKHDLAIIENHGQVTVGRNFQEVLRRAVFFEFACGILLRGGEQIKTLPEEAASFLYQAREKNDSRAQNI